MNSTLAGEAMAASAALAEVEWVQQILVDVLNDRPASEKWYLEVGPFVTIQRDSTEMS